MTLRENLTERQRWAHETLDKVRAGLSVPRYKIMQALIILGDGVE